MEEDERDASSRPYILPSVSKWASIDLDVPELPATLLSYLNPLMFSEQEVQLLFAIRGNRRATEDLMEAIK